MVAVKAIGLLFWFFTCYVMYDHPISVMAFMIGYLMICLLIDLMGGAV